MKKTLALVLAMLMLLTAFVACAPNNEKKDGKTDKATACPPPCSVTASS